MKRTFTAATSLTVSLAAGLLFSGPALAHEPKAVAGGFSAWIMHQLSETDHLLAITALVVVAGGLYLFKKTAAAHKPD